MTQGRPDQSHRFTPRTRPVVPPIHHSVTYFLDDEAYKDVQAGGLDEIWYGRFRNPTVDVAAEVIRDLEGAEAAFMTASGMGAIATTLLTLLRAGDRIVAARQVYGDTRDLLVRDLPAWGFDVVQVDAMDLDAWRQAVNEGSTRVLYVETLANPQLDLADLPALADIAHAAGALLVVDNTFATPYSVQPLSLGADVVVHSATKFLNGALGRDRRCRGRELRPRAGGPAEGDHPRDLPGSARGVPRLARPADLRAAALPGQRDRTGAGAGAGAARRRASRPTPVPSGVRTGGGRRARSPP
ncbi:hypothetical protein DDE18_07870 [Nocardioides gansuensis]|uniref:homocysteine desulfhydrase n=1 Tax=Nocardioides gansuensis TaxID=2138300 RepID=A0A2T8FBX5_9ACTN|nr:hypothetical protein DDE18_07870 [Nocardioides gansuensis]